MAQGAPLFVVCKNCGSEVSPYVTECPYCGQRVRKRAPKLERGAARERPRRSTGGAPRVPRLSRLRPNEIPGVRADASGRPYATIVLVAASFLVYLVGSAGAFDPTNLIVHGATAAEPSWHALTAPFVHYSGGNGIFAGGAYQFATMVAVGVFGWLLERRHGPLVPLLVYLLAGVGGMLVASVVDPSPLAGGSNGLGLGMLCAWAVPDLLAWRRDDEWEGDLLGTAAIAAVLLLMPLAVDLANVWAGLTGALVGLGLGVPLSLLSRR